jgi:hypothetical protein
MIPRLRIDGCMPGTRDYMPVTILRDDRPGLIDVFLTNVPLATARIIVDCVNHCRQELAELDGMHKRP